MPTRYLKPGIRDSDLIDKLSPMAETLFYRLIVTVDDFGRFDARPSMIKSQCFPVKDAITPKKCAELLEELAQVGVVVLYKVGEKPCLQLLKWDNKPRASASLYPAPDDTCIQTHTDVRIGDTNLPVTGTVTGTKTETVDSGSAQAQTPPPPYRGEANEAEIHPKAKVMLAADWELPEPWGVDAENLGWPAKSILHEAEKFRQFYTVGKGGGTRRGLKGWRQSWSNWLSNAEKFAPIRRVV